MTFDAHIDAPWNRTKYVPQDWEIGNVYGRAVDFPRMREGGLNGAVFALYLPDSWQETRTQDEIDQLIGQQLEWIEAAPKDLKIVPGLEGAGLLGLDWKHHLLELKARGLQYVTLVHNRSNQFADSATDPGPTSRYEGLSDEGRQLVKRLAALGIWIDLSHASDTVVEVVLEMGLPCIASHSGCRAITTNVRNLRTSDIAKIVGTGGVIGISFTQRMTEDMAIEHVKWAVDHVGADHVGIGSDLDGAVMNRELRDVSQWKTAVVDGLLTEGFSPEDTAKIAGGNWERVFGL